MTRMSSFGRKKKPEKEADAPSVAPRATKAHDGRFVGDDVVLTKAAGLDELTGARGEAILYDFYEELYTVMLEGYGRRLLRVQVAPDALKRAARW